VHQVGHLPELYEDPRSEKYIKNEKKIRNIWLQKFKIQPCSASVNLMNWMQLSLYCYICV